MGHGFDAVGRMCPPPRSLAAEANGCFMVRTPQGSNRIQGCGAGFRALAGSPRFVCYSRSQKKVQDGAVRLSNCNASRDELAGVEKRELKAMKPGPKPLLGTTMTHAERQARYRATHAEGAPKFRYRKPADRRSRPQRWRDAVAELLELQIDYQAWLDALPENLAVSTTADALREICGLDLSELTSVEPPRGFGRD